MAWCDDSSRESRHLDSIWKMMFLLGLTFFPILPFLFCSMFNFRRLDIPPPHLFAKKWSKLTCRFQRVIFIGNLTVNKTVDYNHRYKIWRCFKVFPFFSDKPTKNDQQWVGSSWSSALQLYQKLPSHEKVPWLYPFIRGMVMPSRLRYPLWGISKRYGNNIDYHYILMVIWQ